MGKKLKFIQESDYNEELRILSPVSKELNG